MPRIHMCHLFAVTTVPLLVKDQRKLFPFLKKAFTHRSALDGKEVYAFSPSTLTVVKGDTTHFTLLNPEHDVHSFVLPDLAVRCRLTVSSRRTTSPGTLAFMQSFARCGRACP